MRKVCSHQHLHRCLSNMSHCTVADTSLGHGEIETIPCQCATTVCMLSGAFLPWCMTIMGLHGLPHAGQTCLLPQTWTKVPSSLQAPSDPSTCLAIHSRPHPESLVHPLLLACACPPFPSWPGETQLERVHAPSACQRVSLAVIAVRRAD